MSKPRIIYFTIFTADYDIINVMEIIDNKIVLLDIYSESYPSFEDKKSAIADIRKDQKLTPDDKVICLTC